MKEKAPKREAQIGSHSQKNTESCQSQQLIVPGLAINKEFPEETRLAKQGVSVWVLAAYTKALGGDIPQVAKDYDVPVDQTLEALNYYNQHKKRFDAMITLQQADLP